jgi:hypothetical protein
LLPAVDDDRPPNISTNWPAKEERRLVGEGAGGELRSAELMMKYRSKNVGRGNETTKKSKLLDTVAAGR